MTRKSTDVHGSIAGYYYQMLLACREVTSSSTDIVAVGVETGADVRIFKTRNKESSLEAKFYKKNIGMYDVSIYKTIDNFYRNSFEDDILIFETNSSPTSTCISFFDGWSSTTKDIEKKKFVKNCILRRSIEADEIKKKAFKIFKEKSEKDYSNDSEAITSLLSKIEIGDEIYSNYAYINTSLTYDDFIKKLKFVFRKTDKFETIVQIKNESISNIMKLSTKLGHTITLLDAEKILYLVVDNFFEKILINSKLTNPQIDKLQTVKTADVTNIINNYEEIELSKEFDYIFRENIKMIEQEEGQFLESLYTLEKKEKEQLAEKYSQIQQIFLSLISTREGYNRAIKSYSLGDKGNVSNVYSVIKQATLLAHYKKRSDEDISFQWKNEFSSNILIKDILEYCLKSNPSPNINTFNHAVRQFYQSCNDIDKIEDSQIFVFDVKFARDCEPCNESLNKAVFNIAGVDQNLVDYNYFKSLSFKCSDCIRVCDTSEKTELKINEFLDCRGKKDE